MTASPDAPTGHAPEGAPNVVIIGAGPAGLTAAYELVTRYGITSTILESDAVVGGISRTVERDGWRFDIGGHRFFTKVQEVEELWHEILPDEDFLLRPRMSRIYYKGKYYDYPIKAVERAAGTSASSRRSAACCRTSGRASVRRRTRRRSRAGSSPRFGWRLYKHFFKTYNEKLWGVPRQRAPADFAAQRIKNLSLFNAVVNALHAEAATRRHITVADRGVPVPEVRPGHDVGALPRPRRGAGLHGR